MDLGGYGLVMKRYRLWTQKNLGSNLGIFYNVTLNVLLLYKMSMNIQVNETGFWC